MPTSLEISAATHVGRVRQNNQDCALVGNWIGAGEQATQFETYQFAKPTFPCIVTDGIGGTNAGEVASKLAVNILRKQFDSASHPVDIQAAVATATLDVFNQSLTRPGLNRMGTTAVGALFFPDRSVMIFNVGDSRAYFTSDGTMKQVSTDDTRTVGTDRKSGHVLTQAIGGSDSLQIPNVHIHHTQPLPVGATIVLCSDGLYDMVSEVEIANEICKRNREAAPELIALAINNGGHDNITAIVARFT